MGGDDIFQFYVGDIFVIVFDYIVVVIDEIKKVFFVVVFGIVGMQLVISFQYFCSGFWVEKIFFEDGFFWYVFNIDFIDFICWEWVIVIVVDLCFVVKFCLIN